MGLMLGGSDRPISEAIIAPAISSAKNIIRLANPNSNPDAHLHRHDPHQSQRHPEPAQRRRQGRADQAAIKAPSASRNCTGKLEGEKMGNTDSMALTRRKTIRPVVQLVHLSGLHCVICGIFWIMPVVNWINSRNIHGISITRRATMPSALGTNVSVCSWMDVTD